MGEDSHNPHIQQGTNIQNIEKIQQLNNNQKQYTPVLQGRGFGDISSEKI